ncbi:hypothetical protein Bequi_09845 [Brachybacterium sp. JHP9]|uniref:Uncharacterized protein n=1 Tax=Brachybacterium equifaecis TaxID=2910770 RepID=A0ABT0R434_9MICO|nr:hypothetical protein [Brachybacterium equifaecis]MCL6423685.1 hypothetical protein [Brachybacterium equifaecis]
MKKNLKDAWGSVVMKAEESADEVKVSMRDSRILTGIIILDGPNWMILGEENCAIHVLNRACIASVQVQKASKRKLKGS